ncbi:hypothetical protein IP76_20745 [Rhizobium sp. AAP43]|nr:hypothetical protein IP76_20745 [Rhizobium sp. AAP43]
MFTAPFKVVVTEFRTSIMLDKMRMFFFCSRRIEESSNSKLGNIILNIRMETNFYRNQCAGR